MEVVIVLQREESKTSGWSEETLNSRLDHLCRGSTQKALQDLFGCFLGEIAEGLSYFEWYYFHVEYDSRTNCWEGLSNNANTANLFHLMISGARPFSEHHTWVHPSEKKWRTSSAKFSVFLYLFALPIHKILTTFHVTVASHKAEGESQTFQKLVFSRATGNLRGNNPPHKTESAAVCTSYWL